MKLIVFKINNGNSVKKHRSDENRIERFFLLSLILIFTVLIIAQTALISPSIESSIDNTVGLEGRPLGIEEYLYSEGKIGLELINSKSDENVKILVNGDEITAFSNSFVSITVKDGDIVEIDGSNAMQQYEVAIVSKTDNISEASVNKKLKTGPGVKILTQIRIE